MPVDIKTIPLATLQKDLEDSKADITVCQAALRIGIEEHNGYNMEERIKKNKYFIKVITAEIERRKAESQ